MTSASSSEESVKAEEPLVQRSESDQKELDQLISKTETDREKIASPWLACLAGSLLLYLSYAPVDWGFLAWIGTLPWLLMIRTPAFPTRGYRCLYLSGLMLWGGLMQWMRYGDPLMYIGWGLMAFYLAFYPVLFVWFARRAVHQWKCPLVIAAPVCWVAGEHLRAYFLTGFSWYQLGHSQYQWTSFIQLADLTGSYGLSAVVLTWTAALAMAFPASWLKQLGFPVESSSQQPTQTGGTVVPLVLASFLVVAVNGYGYYRLQQGTFEAGPRVALIQGNFRASIESQVEEWPEVYEVHRSLTGRTTPYRPDVVIWPEGMFRWPLLVADSEMNPQQIQAVAPMFDPAQFESSEITDALTGAAQMARSNLVIGLTTFSAEKDRMRIYNSAQFVTADEGMKKRYDKLHLVPFGEYMPFAESIPGMGAISPLGPGMSHGDRLVSFEQGKHRLLPLICYEDTVPHLVKRLVSLSAENDQQVDVLLSLSNDGWFAGSSEHDQHLITAQFRAIETRLPLARACNMGISAIVNGNGQVVEPEVILTLETKEDQPVKLDSMINPETGRYWRSREMALVGTVPLDPRSSFYVRWGDWFAWLSSLLCLTAGLGFFRKSKPSVPAAQ